MTVKELKEILNKVDDSLVVMGWQKDYDHYEALDTPCIGKPTMYPELYTDLKDALLFG